MTLQILHTNCYGEDLTFSNYGSFFWEKESSLFLSDIHIGKLSHFRKEGIGVPNHSEKNNIQKMEELINFHHPSRVIFLGDLFHSVLNKSWELIKKLTEKYAKIEFILIKGNHDILPVKNYESIQLKVKKELIVNQFHFTHEPIKTNKINVYGHLHPAIKLKGKGNEKLILKCFLLQSKSFILPSFGEFTGNFVLKPKKDNRVIIIHKDFIMEKKI